MNQARQDSNLGIASGGNSLSLARSWHKCERYEIEGIACPFMSSGIETPDVGGPESLTRLTSDLPLPRTPTIPPIGSRPRRPQPPTDFGEEEDEIPEDDTPDINTETTGGGPIHIDLQRANPLRFGLSRVETDEIAAPQGGDPFPWLFLPDGTPINLNYLLNDSEEPYNLPDPEEDERLTPNMGEERIRAVNRQYNQMFANLPDTWTPPPLGERTKTSRSGEPLQERTLLANYVQAASQAEISYAPAYAQELLPSRGTERETQDTTSSRTPHKFIGAGIAAAAIGGAALLGAKGRRGGGGGMFFNANEEMLALIGQPAR